MIVALDGSELRLQVSPTPSLTVREPRGGLVSGVGVSVRVGVADGCGVAVEVAVDVLVGGGVLVNVGANVGVALGVTVAVGAGVEEGDGVAVRNTVGVEVGKVNSTVAIGDVLSPIACPPPGQQLG